MAVCLRSSGVSDLCIGRPALRWIPSASTVGDALAAIRKTGAEGFVTVWSCEHSIVKSECRCLGKVCMVDVICFLSRDDNLARPASALRAPVSALFPATAGKDAVPTPIRHVQPDLSLLEALDLMVDGAQNLVIQRKPGFGSKKYLQKLATVNSGTGAGVGTLWPATTHNGKEFCWVTQEDLVRFLLGSIGLFSPLPAATIDDLGLIADEFLCIRYDEPASLACHLIGSALASQTSVAVVTGDADPRLIGEISPETLACCDESVALAIATLSAGDLMAYIDCGSLPESLVAAVRARAREKTKRLSADNDFFPNDASTDFSSEEEDEFSSGMGSPTGPLKLAKLPAATSFGRDHGSTRAARVRHAEAIACRPWSSLVAVMVQALAHRVSYVWVTDDDHRIVGIVTFATILRAFRDHISPSLAE